MDFWKIHDQYYARVRKFILSLVKDEWVADDLIQETFLKIQQNLDTIRDGSKVSPWIFRIAYNLCQDHFRQSRKSPLGEGAIQENLRPFEETLVQRELEQQEMGQCIQAQMGLLPEPLRTVLVLFDVLDFSHQEIADILDLTVGNVKVRLHRARSRFKAILEEKCTFEVDERNVLVCEPMDGKKI